MEGDKLASKVLKIDGNPRCNLLKKEKATRVFSINPNPPHGVDTATKTANVDVHPVNVDVHPANVVVHPANVRVHTANVSGHQANVSAHTADKNVHPARVDVYTENVVVHPANVSVHTANVSGHPANVSAHTADASKSSLAAKVINIDGRPRIGILRKHGADPALKTDKHGLKGDADKLKSDGIVAGSSKGRENVMVQNLNVLPGDGLKVPGEGLKVPPGYEGAG
ncbi:hypothetical protein QVD17_24463 [Tagetes erecta]|uniref:Uncharacterized protein n=1 Tax=Tagetes erecta TaxID=13708 RepID=A0AAD8NV20_TARER|nr:hypothetical protein QVD17_24463 [Tagetes erecta]